MTARTTLPGVSAMAPVTETSANELMDKEMKSTFCLVEMDNVKDGTRKIEDRSAGGRHDERIEVPIVAGSNTVAHLWCKGQCNLSPLPKGSDDRSSLEIENAKIMVDLPTQLSQILQCDARGGRYMLHVKQNLAKTTHPFTLR